MKGIKLRIPANYALGIRSIASIRDTERINFNEKAIFPFRACIHILQKTLASKNI